MSAQFSRYYKAAKSAIHTLELDLSRNIVLTELGSGAYMFSTIIPALAGARKIYAWTKDTKYGPANLLIEQCKAYLDLLAIDTKVFFRTSSNIDDIKDADIITNSGMLRPLNSAFLSHLKPGAVIPLMYEAWEIREADIDLPFCKKNKIPVAGTLESYEGSEVFQYIKPLCAKLCLDAGFEVMGNKIIVWSNDDFGKKAKEAFLENHAREVVLTSDVGVLSAHVSDADFVFLCDYNETRPYFGKLGILDVHKLQELNPDIGIVHLYGEVDAKQLQALGITVYPLFNGRSKTMSFTLAHVGPAPVINLLVGGFKVGQLLKEKQYNHPLVQILSK